MGSVRSALNHKLTQFILVLLLAFWGFLGLTLYMMIGIAGPGAAATAKKTFVIIGGSDCLLMLGIALIWMLTGSTRMDQPALPFSAENVYIAFLCFAVAPCPFILGCRTVAKKLPYL